MKWSDEVTIETPEQIDVALEIAGLGSRFMAQAWDWLFKGLACCVLLLLVIVASALLGVSPAQESSRMWLAILAVVLGYLILLGADIYFETKWNGQTPGKWLAGIRVMREGGAPVDFRAACIRNLLGLADMLPSFYLLGGLLVLVNRRGQRLGDMAAGTIVVRERSLALPLDFSQEIAAHASDEFAFTPTQLEACGLESRFILRAFFERVRHMDASARDVLAAKLAEQFLQKTGYQPATSVLDGRRIVSLLASLYRDLESLASMTNGVRESRRPPATTDSGRSRRQEA